MRGADAMQESLFTVAKLDDFVPEDHPLRGVRLLVNTALVEMNTRFNEIYAPCGRDSIAPEKLIRALLLQVFYSIRSERQLCEQLRYNLLFRWFVGLAIDDPVWDHSTFSKNRDRLLEHQVLIAGPELRNHHYLTCLGTRNKRARPASGRSGWEFNSKRIFNHYNAF